ncbi:MAG TPA: tetratricopeptide repeat protein [Ktedonobacterales bacterium]|nr:tetratricopeptide repeat protein [Ktedonobacterales bacterium]
MSQSALSEGLRAVETEIAAGRSDRALELCQQLTTRFPRALAAQRALGEVFLTLRKPREALGALDRALAGNPEDARAYCARAIVQQIQGDPTAALAWYRRACDITPDDQVLRGAYAELAAHLHQPPYVPTRAGLARLYLRGDLFEHAMREWEGILAEQPGLLEAQVGLAETLWRASYFEAAAERCQRILANAPSCVKALLILAAVEHDGGREEEADRLARRASELDPEARIGRALYADRLAAGDVALRALLLGEPRPVRPPSAPLARSTPSHGPAARSQPSSGPVASRAGAPFSQPLTGAGNPPQAQPQPSALPPDFHTIFAETEYMLWGRDEDDPTGATAALSAPAGPNGPPVAPPAMAGSAPPGVPIPPTARGDTSARLAAVIPALQQQGGSLDETEVRAKVNFINWLQAQGARARDAAGAFSTGAPAPSLANTPPGAPSVPPSPPPAVSPPASAFAAGPAGGVNMRMTNPLPSSSLPTGPLPPPSPAALREMFAELGGDTASSRIVEGELVAVNDADAPRATAAGPDSDTLDADEQAAIETERVAATHGPQTRNRRRETMIPVGSGSQDPFSSEPPTDLAAHQEGAPSGAMTLEALDQHFAGSGFQSFELRPGELAALAASGGAAAEGDEQPARGAAATRPLDGTSLAASTAPTAEAEPEPADYPARLERARSHREEGRLTEALADYRLVLRNAPDLLSDVIADLNDLLADHSEQPELHRLLGDARIREGDYLSAIESYNRAVALAHAQSE